MKYTSTQIAEFAKMGYQIDENGNLTKETRIQKIMRTSAAANTIRTIELAETTVKITKEIDRKSPVSSVKLNFRVQEDWLDPERLARGLVTAKQKGVDYSLLPDGTKVCRCCQERTSKDNFYKAASTKDGLRTICKSCNNKQSKTYISDVKKKAA
jgi:hypothetical protein